MHTVGKLQKTYLIIIIHIYLHIGKTIADCINLQSGKI